ncbi:MAG: hypothetical protein ACPKM0_09660 [Pleomorphochaeta sp.]
MIVKDKNSKKEFRLDLKKGAYREIEEGNYSGIPVGEIYYATCLDDNLQYELIFKTTNPKFNIFADNTIEIYVEEIRKL